MTDRSEADLATIEQSFTIDVVTCQVPDFNSFPVNFVYTIGEVAQQTVRFEVDSDNTACVYDAVLYDATNNNDALATKAWTFTYGVKLTG